ncbi:type II toxin-antitoxin system RelE/ParE family toxin [Caulobacter hibisci]|uniref:Type II toxin-antitoxin system RelE/ParE family toxin n=1 Tax=Caulobacter hibisci TaxID=2035993 RepID=A0ABS0T3L3_9CAUL|nr:type II toxin-antitoxin system RelE/ParE family toxin [Caulobacter hibisci]MBI1686468.1 type II toxin-antitoxin system RelE/ParE family toxin [Caulobacter hibisci]
METVVETPAYLRQAKVIGMTKAEMDEAVAIVSVNPLAGDLLVGSGGCRKVRVGGKGKGKSGGYRVVTVIGGGDLPVFILWVLSKGSTSALTKAQTNALSAAVKDLQQSYSTKSA